MGHQPQIFLTIADLAVCILPSEIHALRQSADNSAELTFAYSPRIANQSLSLLREESAHQN
ncbi:MAG: hypothetical protein CBE00_06755 [Planctomycetaceae bacterium TMED240]|nr:hypothetical protein [Rhodopirellula sp.]OUX06705.1 MAG: hypothetical protein CBE00_06755 [Planctomycetaceae bacterium TMED240]